MEAHTDPIGADDERLEKQAPTIVRIKAEFFVDLANPEISWWVRRLQGPPFGMTGSVGGRGGPDNDVQVGLERFFNAIRRQVEDVCEPF